MRKRLTLFVVLLCTSGAAAVAEMTQLDRQRLVSHLEMTSSWLIDEVSNLSQPQLEFRPVSGSWNILEVLDHLVVVGPIYWQDLQNAIKTPAGARGRPDADADILWYGIDRVYREKAIPSEVASGKLKDLRSGLEAYRRHHGRLLEYVKTTKDDLRAHSVQRQRSDAYQWALLISTHEQRHILQIREIKRHPAFPKR